MVLKSNFGDLLEKGGKGRVDSYFVGDVLGLAFNVYNLMTRFYFTESRCVSFLSLYLNHSLTKMSTFDLFTVKPDLYFSSVLVLRQTSEITSSPPSNRG